MMAARRVLLFGIDGYDPEIGASLIAEGRLPTLGRLLQQGLRYDLDHGPARRTGLAWEHIATGLTPEAAGRQAALHLDSRAYEMRQRPTQKPPFTSALDVPVLVYNAPYFDLQRSPQAQGIVAWGSHDPGVPTTACPAPLLKEVQQRFGDYPSRAWTYAVAWPSAERTRRMGEALVAGIEYHCRVARWLFAERSTDWRLGYIVCSESHSAVEALMHGWLPGHPLAGHPSAAAARQGLIGCYEALDRYVATMAAALPGVTLVLVTPHGMGLNKADLPGMLLMAELMHREFAGRPVYRARSAWEQAEVPLLADDAGGWNHQMRQRCELPPSARRWWRQSKAQLARSRLGRGLRVRHPADRPDSWPVDWMPCAWYRDSWPKMDAFAIPAYYDAQVRVNLAGREAKGRVTLAQYEAVLERVERTLRECSDWRSGEPLRFQVHRREVDDPRTLGPTDSDLTFDLQDCTLGWRHPRHGLIGPAPMRRTGGHTGGYGLLLVTGPGIEARHGGLASTFDVTPTVVSLLGLAVPPGLSGRPLPCSRRRVDRRGLPA
jgi:predicted AlkP superfamily phosphohydrolase/phosphomutase